MTEEKKKRSPKKKKKKRRGARHRASLKWKKAHASMGKGIKGSVREPNEGRTV